MQRWQHHLLGLFSGLALSAPALATPAYHVSVDTAALAGSAGFLDFTLGGLLDSPAAHVSITGLSGGNANGSTVLDGDAGTLAGGWQLGNLGAFNGVYQGWQFGNRLDFDLAFGGDWLSATSGSGSTLAFKLWDTQGQTLLTSDGNGDLLRFELSAGGQVGVNRFPDASGGSPAATVAAVPEPQSVVLMLVGLAVLGWRLRRTRA